jgi:hypothetical protein
MREGRGGFLKTEHSVDDGLYPARLGHGRKVGKVLLIRLRQEALQALLHERRQHERLGDLGGHHGW